MKEQAVESLDMSFMAKRLKMERRARRMAAFMDRTGPVILFVVTLTFLGYCIFFK